MKTETLDFPHPRPLVAALWIAVVVWMCLVTWLSSKPGSFFPKVDLPQADKVVHLILYTGGSFFTAGSLLLTFRWPRPVIYVVTVLLISLFGVVDEYHQLSTPGRSGGDVGDWTADTLGGIAGVCLMMIILKIWKKRTVSPAPTPVALP